MAGRKKVSSEGKENKEVEEDNQIVLWLKKIHDRMEKLDRNQEEQTEILKRQQISLTEIMNDVAAVKQQMANLGDKGCAISPNKETNHFSSTSPQLSLSELSIDAPKICHSRKLAYYNQIRSEGIAKIYKSFIEQDPPFIPRKFREGQIPGQSHEQRVRKEKLENFKMTLEIERLEEECSKQQEILDEAERKIEQIIGQHDDPSERQKFKEMWINIIKREEEKSNTIWIKRRQFFENLPNNPGHHQRELIGNMLQLERGHARNHTSEPTYHERKQRTSYRNKATGNFPRRPHHPYWQ